MTDRLAYGSDIPGARAELFRVAERLDQIAKELCSGDLITGLQVARIKINWEATVLRELTRSKMTRRYTGRVAPARRGIPRNWQVTKVKLLAKNFPLLQQQDIAIRCRLNAGRVSEILSGLIYVDPNTGQVRRVKRGS